MTGRPLPAMRPVARCTQRVQLRISDQFDWANWLAAIGMTGVGGQRDLYFSHSHLALQAAAEGQGVALASSAYIADDFTSGRLIRPFGDLCVRGAMGSLLCARKLPPIAKRSRHSGIGRLRKRLAESEQFRR